MIDIFLIIIGTWAVCWLFTTALIWSILHDRSGHKYENRGPEKGKTDTGVAKNTGAIGGNMKYILMAILFSGCLAVESDVRWLDNENHARKAEIQELRALVIYNAQDYTEEDELCKEFGKRHEYHTYPIKKYIKDKYVWHCHVWWWDVGDLTLTITQLKARMHDSQCNC